ncbi:MULTISPECIES: hypothetical protein [Vagococcus]|uniref:hypothetical protein n=1 Tax=Vagococcus TaxID=2737 RepID=UPI000E4A5A8D|nr:MULTISPECIES: hypothetical protein [Vagococcus]RHH70098.1 hypothetical protein DW196_04855 [Vagococcus sp. AM17-17]
MALEMRELKGDDVFSLLSIVGKLDIKDEFVKMFESSVEDAIKSVPTDKKKKEPTRKEREEAELKAQKRGMNAVALILQKVLLNINLVKSDINELLAELTGKKVSEIKEIGLKEYTSLLVAFFKKPELADFFSSIASLLK